MEEMPIIERAVPVADNGWAGLLFLAVFLVFGLVLSLHGKQYFKKMKLLNMGHARIVSYDDNIVSWVFVSLLWVATIVSMSLTVSAIIARLAGSVIDVVSFGVVLGISAAYIGIKFGLMYLIMYVFDVGETVFIEEMKIIVVLFGAVIALAGLGLAYVSNIWIGVAICAVALLSGIVAEAVLLVKNFYRRIGSLFYIFLYLCAAEILPLLVGAKWVSQVLN